MLDRMRLSHSVIGDHVRIGAGSVIGEAGFGFEMTEMVWLKFLTLALF